MTGDRKTLAEVTSRAILILSRELGPVDTIRFINQFTNGHGDYAADRDEILGNTTLDQIITEIKGPVTPGDE